MWPCSGISHRPEWRSTTGSRHCAGKGIQNWILYQDMHCGCREFKTEYFTPRHALWLQGIQIWILYQDVHIVAAGNQNWILYQDKHYGCREFKTEYFIKTCTVAAGNSKLNTLSRHAQVTGLILGLHPANERQCYFYSHWLGASLESAQHALWLNGIQNWIRY